MSFVPSIVYCFTFVELMDPSSQRSCSIPFGFCSHPGWIFGSSFDLSAIPCSMQSFTYVGLPCSCVGSALGSALAGWSKDPKVGAMKSPKYVHGILAGSCIQCQVHSQFSHKIYYATISFGYYGQWTHSGWSLTHACTGRWMVDTRGMCNKTKSWSTANSSALRRNTSCSLTMTQPGHGAPLIEQIIWWRTHRRTTSCRGSTNVCFPGCTFPLTRGDKGGTNSGTITWVVHCVGCMSKPPPCLELEFNVKWY